MAKKQNKRNVRTCAKNKRSFSGVLAKVKQSMKWLFGLLAGAALAGVLVFGVIWLMAVDTNNVFPLNRLEVKGQKYTQGEELYAVLQQVEDRGFFSMDMQLAEQKLLNLPWVKRVQLRKIWPKILSLQIQEHQPLAFWGQTGVVSTQGDVFYPPQLPKENWVTLSGPEPLASELTELLQTYQEQLDQKQLFIKSMQLTERGSVSLQLENEIEVKLGKYQVAQRLQRFIEQIDTVKSYKKSPLAYVDLRYQNGLVVAWQQALTPLKNNDNSSR